MAYDVFISHAWSYSERYVGVIRLLDTATQNLSWFSYRDYSVPRNEPIVAPNENVRISVLKDRLKEQIRQASCVIVPAGMYVNERYWIQTEIDLALNGFMYPKPIIGIRRRNQQRTPVELEQQADVMVNWNSNSLAGAIYQVCQR
ncbi:TIR domain-containing protein [Neorhizobium galegae]|uniref:TIR domain-containing protein n=1 Tax=Neorhizobium galegae TaxID=399 RepID=UPI00210839B7|nr:TIR domain-containing protein [Neorhizobium galegae]MCQ1764717.1 TIR domain-containing protein [Neorhizobium galegae]MCQ1849288.1 TIR domain-containing protein [Neorhizobium galegae]